MSLTAILSLEHLILVLKVSMNRNLYCHLSQVRVRSNGAVSSHFLDIILAGFLATANVDLIVDSVKVLVGMQQLRNAATPTRVFAKIAIYL